jgi:hypothetical protein
MKYKKREEEVGAPQNATKSKPQKEGMSATETAEGRSAMETAEGMSS